MGKSILTTNQSKLLESASTSELITSHFYLTGGTALSEFYFKHRISEDLDFFSEQEINDRQLTLWIKETSIKLKSETEVQALNGQYTYFFHFPDEDIKVDFAYFPFTMLGKSLKYNRLLVSSVEDIATNKIQAILTRCRGRDYFDLYKILNNREITLDKILQDYRLKFDIGISYEQLAKKFTAILDASDQPRFIEKVNWKIIEGFFLSEAKKLEHKLLI